MPPFSSDEGLSFFNRGKYCANMSGQTTPAACPPGDEEEEEKEGKKGEKVGPTKPISTGLKDMFQHVYSHKLAL